MTSLESFLERKITEWRGKTITDHEHFLHELEKTILESYVAGKQQAYREIKEIGIEKAHTYGSENADIYRAHDAGQEYTKDKIISQLEELKEK